MFLGRYSSSWMFLSSKDDPSAGVKGASGMEGLRPRDGQGAWMTANECSWNGGGENGERVTQRWTAHYGTP